MNYNTKDKDGNPNESFETVMLLRQQIHNNTGNDREIGENLESLRVHNWTYLIENNYCNQTDVIHQDIDIGVIARSRVVALSMIKPDLILYSVNPDFYEFRTITYVNDKW